MLVFFCFSGLFLRRLTKKLFLVDHFSILLWMRMCRYSFFLYPSLRRLSIYFHRKIIRCVSCEIKTLPLLQAVIYYLCARRYSLPMHKESPDTRLTTYRTYLQMKNPTRTNTNRIRLNEIHLHHAESKASHAHKADFRVCFICQIHVFIQHMLSHYLRIHFAIVI